MAGLLRSRPGRSGLCVEAFEVPAGRSGGFDYVERDFEKLVDDFVVVGNARLCACVHVVIEHLADVVDRFGETFEVYVVVAARCCAAPAATVEAGWAAATRRLTTAVHRLSVA